MEKYTDTVVDWMMRCNVINKEDKELYEYALHSLILFVSPLIFAAGIGFLVGSVKHGVVLVFPLMVLRKFSGGYHAKNLYTCISETVVLLSKGEVDSKKIRVEFSLEDMDMSEFQDGATYPQIKEYVLEHTGLKVSSLYISQIKRKCGLEVGKNYNLPKSEDSRQPQCPPEKEKAIREAFKYFGMI